MFKVFDVVSTIYDKYKPKGRKSFLNYPFVLKQILIIMGKVEYAKYIPKLKTHSKQRELERLWCLITKDPEWAVALRKRKIILVHHLNDIALVDAFEHICLLFYTHLPTI